MLVQGLNRQIRLMAAHFGHRVKQLLRVRIGNVKLGHLKPGQWRNLTEAELRALLPHTNRVVRPTLVVGRSPGHLNLPPDSHFGVKVGYGAPTVPSGITVHRGPMR